MSEFFIGLSNEVLIYEMLCLTIQSKIKPNLISFWTRSSAPKTLILTSDKNIIGDGKKSPEPATTHFLGRDGYGRIAYK